MSKRPKVKSEHYLLLGVIVAVVVSAGVYFNIPSMVFSRGPGGGSVDHTAPAISNIKVINITSTSATFTWTTNELAYGTVCYSPSKPVKSTNCYTNNLNTEQSLTLTYFSPGKTYYYTIRADDPSSNTATSQTMSFTTLVTPVNTAPTVTITAPPNNSIVNGYFVIAADASDDVGVTQVEFELNGSRFLTDTTFPYGFGWDPQPSPEGIKTFTAVARDANGNWTRSAPVSVNYSTTIPSNDVIPPTISITSPINNSTISGTVTVSANAQDDFEITFVQFFLNGQQIWGSWQGPFSLQWDTLQNPNGIYVLTAVARDLGKNFATSSVTVTVNNPQTDTISPSVPTGVSGSATSTSLITLTWNASTDNVGVKGYKVYRNGVLVGNPTATWFSDSGLSAGTTYSYSIAALDAAGNISQQSSPISASTLSTSTATTTTI
jgi:chitinase